MITTTLVGLEVKKVHDKIRRSQPKLRLEAAFKSLLLHYTSSISI